MIPRVLPGINLLLLFILHNIQCHFSYPDGALAVLVDWHRSAIQIIQILQLLEVGMAMTAQYQVDVTGSWGYLGIVDAIYLPAQVGDADDDITLLFLLQYLCHFLCLGDRIEILDAAIVDFGYQAGKFRTQAENANLQSLALDNGIRLYDICQFGTGEIIVGADDRNFAILKMRTMLSIPKSNSWFPMVAASYFISFISPTSTSPLKRE